MAERAHPKDPGFQDHWSLTWKYHGLIPWVIRWRSPWKKGLIERYKFCVPHVKGKRVLEIPCGVGWGTSMIRGAKKVVGLDLDSNSIEYARQHYSNFAEFQVGDMSCLAFPERTFDVVICLEGIEHVPVEVGRKFIKESARILDIGGKIIITNPLPDPQREPNPYHIHEYELQEFRDLVSHNFTTVCEEIHEIGGVKIIYFVGRVKK